GNGVVRLWILRLFFQAEDMAAFVKLNNAIGRWILYIVGKDGCARFEGCSGLQDSSQAFAVENVISQDQGDGFTGDKFTSDDEGIRKAPWFVLHSIGELYAPLRTITEQGLKKL